MAYSDDHIAQMVHLKSLAQRVSLLLDFIDGQIAEIESAGTGLRILDYYDSLSALQSGVQNPDAGDTYGVGTAYPYDIYIYSPSKGWVNNGHIQGPQGVQGPQGPQGPIGNTGPQGPAGSDGEDGAPGAQGPAGENGATFTPAVDASGNLSWTNDKSLSNPQTVNIRGPQGPQGPAGADGAPGAKGETGPEGPQGKQGPQGETGPQGPAGQDGAPGEQGPAGTAATIAVGTVTASDPGSTPQVTNRGTASAAVFDFVLPRGAQGPAGADGAPGADGQDGAEGPQGPAGPNEVSTTTGTNITGLLKGNGSTVQQAVAGTDYAAAPRTVTATLLATGWESETITDSSTASYVADQGQTYVAVQTVSVTGIAANSTAIVSLAPTNSLDVVKAAASAMLQASTQGNGTVSVRAYAYTAIASGSEGHPEVDIPIQITIL